MTKYILHGGATSQESLHNKNFSIEMLKGLPEPIKILVVYFAISKDKWNELMEDDNRKFSKFNPGKKFELTLATDDIKLFKKQISDSDVIYIRGGRELVIHQLFKQIDNLEDLFKGKVIGGSSAGAYTLSKYFYSNGRDSIEEGTGILPIKVMAHYSPDKIEPFERLKGYKEDLKMYTIPETEFVVIEK